MPRKPKVKPQKVEIKPEGFSINPVIHKNWRPVIKGTVNKRKLTLTDKAKGYMISSAGKILVEKLQYAFKYQIKIARQLRKSKADPRTLSYLMPFYYVKAFEIWVHKDTFAWELVILQKHKLPDFTKAKD